MKRAIAISSLAHLLILMSMALIGRIPVSPSFESAIYTVNLIEFPSVSSLNALDAPMPARRSEPVEPMPPAEVERIKTREKRVDEGEAREVEVASRTEGKGAGEGVTGGSGIRVEGNGFDYPFYFEIIRRRLQANFYHPGTGRSEEKLKTTVYFQITASGAIVNTRVEYSSGTPVFDQVAKRAVLASNPFPPLPETFGGDLLAVHCDFFSSQD